jgi:hypothetical protein
MIPDADMDMDTFSICANLALAMARLDMKGEDRANSYLLGEYWQKLKENSRE